MTRETIAYIADRCVLYAVIACGVAALIVEVM